MAEPIKKAVEQLGEQIQEVTEQVQNATIAATESATPAASTESATPATSENVAPNAPNLQKDEETGEMVSKSELKKRIKAREAAKKKADKLAAAPVVAKKKEVVDVSDLNPNQYFEMRSRQIKGMLDTKEEKTNPWVLSFPPFDVWGWRLNGMGVGACWGFGDLFWKIAGASVGLDLCFIGFEDA